MPSLNRSSQSTPLKRMPMPLLAVIIGLLCGLLVWVVLDQVQSRALRDIFAGELQGRLDQQARETLIRFDNYTEAHISTARLLANHRRLANYLEPLYWFDKDKTPAVVYYQTPQWLPPTSLWKPLARPSHILLVDSNGRTREVYQIGQRPLPEELASTNERYLSATRDRAFLTTMSGRPYLLVSEVAEDATGTVMGALMLVTPIDAEFLKASQQGIAGSDVVVGLLDADEQRFLASSASNRVTEGDSVEEVRQEYLVTAQAFYEYEGAALNLQFATLVPHSSVEAIQGSVVDVGRHQLLVSAVTFISVFTIVFSLLSARLNRILNRISIYSRRALGADQPAIERGNQLLVLEDWVKQFIRLVRQAREEMRKQHESEMQESEALKRAIMETALDSIITIDQNGNIVEFNATAETIFGYSRDQVISQDFMQLVLDPESTPHFLSILEKMASGSVNEGQDVRSEMSAIRGDGKVFPVELAIKPLQLQGRTMFTVYVHDISNRKRAEKEILSLAKFPSESPSPVLRVNQPGVIIYANPASAQLLEYWGCERAQTLPVYWRSRIAEILDSGKDWEVEVSWDDVIYSLLFTPVVDLGYVNIYGRDISEVRKAEGQAREHQQELVHVCRLSTMGEMATGLAHELNQPLSAIANFANGCARRLLDDQRDMGEIISAMRQINNQADRAGEIIKRLRALVGKQQPVRKVADINQVVQEVCSFVEFEARKIGVVIEQELSLSEMTVRIDVVQIEQVLVNLIRNALDALQDVPEQERELIVRTGCNDQGQAVAVQVLDSGPGIEPEVMDRLFEPFFTTKSSGMGMGLIISKTIAEDHNGRIDVGRWECGGTRFTVTLPLHEPIRES